MSIISDVRNTRFIDFFETFLLESIPWIKILGKLFRSSRLVLHSVEGKSLSKPNEDKNLWIIKVSWEKILWRKWNLEKKALKEKWNLEEKSLRVLRNTYVCIVNTLHSTCAPSSVNWRNKSQESSSLKLLNVPYYVRTKEVLEKMSWRNMS